jgi:hypothetical protein
VKADGALPTWVGQKLPLHKLWVFFFYIFWSCENENLASLFTSRKETKQAVILQKYMCVPLRVLRRVTQNVQVNNFTTIRNISCHCNLAHSWFSNNFQETFQLQFFFFFLPTNSMGFLSSKSIFK